MGALLATRGHRALRAEASSVSVPRASVRGAGRDTRRARAAPTVNTMRNPTDIAVVMPAYNASAFLRRSLSKLVEVAGETPVIVVDAGSSDNTAELAQSLGATVLRLPEREGPAGARNAGCDLTDAEVVLFIDADCVPHADTLARVRSAFDSEPELVALSGSYDATPPELNFFSQYVNLRHHLTHQLARRESATFWAGCGAVRRGAFQEAGRFDADRYPRPQIEDIELACRLRPLGRLRLDPALQVTHLKRWTLRSVITTDLFCRALPWARLIAESGALPNDLNLRWSQRVAAALAPFALLAPCILAWALVSGSPHTNLWVAASFVSIGAAVLINRQLLTFFARRRGVWFAINAFFFHQLHLLYSSFTFALVILLERIPWRRRPQVGSSGAERTSRC